MFGCKKCNYPYICDDCFKEFKEKYPDSVYMDELQGENKQNKRA